MPILENIQNNNKIYTIRLCLDFARGFRYSPRWYGNRIAFVQKEMWNISQLNVFHKIVEELAKNFHQGVVYLVGDLGVGKTALVQYWLKICGVYEPVTSPTYQIVNSYAANGRRFLHADLYRLIEPEELLYLDVREWRDLADLVFIEWPEKGQGFIPPPDRICQMVLFEDSRMLTWQ